MMSLIDFLKERFTNRPDTEHQQAFVRIGVGILMTMAMLPDAIRSSNYDYIHFNIVFFFVIFVVPLWMLFDPGVNHARRIFGMVLDMSSIGAAMILSPHHNIVMFVVYLWITSGNGFRFGPKYLLIALALGILSLTVVFNFSDYFKEHKSLAIELMVVYILFTVYVNSLIKQLYEAIDAARSASNAKQIFLSTMSHELRTPLHAIVGLMALLKTESSKRKKSLDLVSTMGTAVEHMLTLINDILDFSKIEAGKIEIIRSEHDIDSLNMSIVKMFIGQAHEKKLNFKMYFSPQLPRSLNTDKTRIRQILSNIFSNAIKFTDQGEIFLTVEPTIDRNGATCIKWSVKDTGIGMSPETIAKIFESFTQADASTARKYGGTGLGTTIARELVLLLGGDVGIDSTLGHGTTFWFTLPYFASVDKNFTMHVARDSSVLVWASDSKTEILDACRSAFGNVYEKISEIEYEISKVPIDVAGMVVQPVGEQLPPLAQFAATKSVKLIVLDPNSSPERKRLFIQLGAISVCKDITELSRALHMLQVWSHDNPLTKESVARSAFTTFVQNKRILIVDDSKTNLHILSASLEMHSHLVTQVMNGDDALDAILTEDFDLFIFDMNMPDMSGLDLTHTLRSLELKNSSKPVVILTADATLEAERATRECGADMFVTKPVTPDVLLEKISSLFLQLPVIGEELNANNPTKHLVFNQAAFQEILKLSTTPDFFPSLVTCYFEDGKAHFEQLLTAFENKDFGRWRAVLHVMKSSAYYLRLECLSYALELAYNLTPQNFDENAESALAQIAYEKQRAEEALSAASGLTIP